MLSAASDLIVSIGSNYTKVDILFTEIILWTVVNTIIVTSINEQTD